jgi:ABC-type antimicrobial peptide transport system permease subunit
VNQEFVRRYFPGQYVVGKILQNYRIIGVVGNLKYGSLRRAIQPAIFSPADMAFSFEVRAQANPEALIPEARDAAAKIDSQIKLSNVTTQRGEIEKSISGDRFITNLLTSFAGLALALACIGVFGLLSYDVTSQTREIGIRMALGAQRSDVLRAVIAKGMAAAAVGVALGLVLASGVTRYIENQLYGVHTIDAATFAAASLVLLLAALAACWIPARRAMRVDPMQALRHE